MALKDIILAPAEMEIIENIYHKRHIAVDTDGRLLMVNLTSADVQDAQGAEQIIQQFPDLTLFKQTMDINFYGAVYCTYYALPYLKQTRGRLVGVSSLAGKNGVPTRSGYAASKHAMAGFFDSLRIEVAPSGVSVTMIYPGFVATAVRERAFGSDGQPLGQSPVRESEVMPVDQCARLIIRAMAQRKRELVMTWRGQVGLWLKLIAPGLVDRIARQAIAAGR